MACTGDFSSVPGDMGLKDCKKSTLQDNNLTWYRREFEKWLNDFKNNYKKDFDKWLNKFKKTNAYDDDEEFEARYNKELHQIFREYVWEPMLLERINWENELLYECY